MVVFALFLLSLAVDQEGDKAIYGPDDRLDFYQLPSNDVFRNIVQKSLVSVMKKNFVEARFDSNTNTYDIFNAQLISLNTLQARQSLCSDQKFLKDPAFAFCSGTLIGPDRVLTAGHCMSTSTSCSTSAFVFGYYVTGRDSAGVPSFEHQITTDDVYFCRNVEFVLRESDGQDYAVVQLDRPVDSTKVPVDVDSVQTPYSVGQSVVLAGSPSGIPTKVAKNAAIKVLASDIFFQANVDAFAGNSGSGVFLPSGHQMGILVRGNTDYSPRAGAGCNIAADTSNLENSSPEQVTYAFYHSEVVDCKSSEDCGESNLCDRQCSDTSTACTGFCKEVVTPETQSRGTISFSDVVSGSTSGRTNNFGVGSPDAVYKISVTEEAEYLFTSCGSDFDTVLGILDANGTVVVACESDSTNSECVCSTCCPGSIDSRASVRLEISPGDELYLLVEGKVDGTSLSSGDYEVVMTASNPCPLSLPLIQSRCTSNSCPLSKKTPDSQCCNPVRTYVNGDCEDNVATVITVPSQCANDTATTFSAFEKTCPSSGSVLGLAVALVAPILSLLYMIRH